jgi:hypothetical protein
MKIAAIQQAEVRDGEIRLTVKDTSGLTRSLELSQRAEEQLLTALLSAPPSRRGVQSVRPQFVAENVRLAMLDDGHIVLEIFLTDKAAIQIALPDPLPSRLHELLGQDPKDWQGPQLN